MPETKSVRDLLAGAAALHPGDVDDLAQWAKAVEESDGKILADCDLAMDTTGVTVEIKERIASNADVEPGTFGEGWIAIPALSPACANCEGEQPMITLGNQDLDVILFDCINCGTRYDIDALEEVAADA